MPMTALDKLNNPTKEPKMTNKDIWDTAAELGVSYEIAKAMLEREERYAAGDETEATDARDCEDVP